MISRNENEEYKFVLNKLFNHIIEIDLIKIKSWKLTMKNKEYNTLFTKYQALNLSNYKKIILIEPNFVILQNPDYLFSLNAPAGLSLKNTSYINTKLLLLEPKLNEFDSIILDITNGINKMKVQEEYSHPDGEYMYKRYDNWKIIGPEFSYLKNKLEKYEHINFIYYDIIPSNMNIIDIEINDIYNIWYKLYNDILKSHTDLVDNKLLKTVNSNLTGLLKNKKMARETITEEFDIINLKNIYETDIIHKIHEPILHKDKFTKAILKDIPPLFDSILKYEYIKPIYKLIEYFDKNIILENLSKYTTSDKIALHKYNYIKASDRDLIMNYYMKCRNNMRILITEHNQTFIDNLDAEIDIFYIKQLHLNKDEYKNLLFLLNNKDNYTQIMTNLHKINGKDSYEISFIFYENKDGEDINKINRDNYIEITDNFINTIELGEMILNENSITLLKQIKLEDLTSSFMGKTNLLIQTMRIWQNQNLSLLEKERLILTGDIYFSVRGLKLITNINGIFISRNSLVDNTEYEKYLEKIISSDLAESNSKIYFMNIKKESTNNYNKTDKIILDSIIKSGLISSTRDLIIDPQNYCYYNGLKILNIDLNISFINANTKNDKLTAGYIALNIINKGLISRFVSYLYNEKKKHGILKINNKEIKLNRKELDKLKKIANKSFIKKYCNLI